MKALVTLIILLPTLALAREPLPLTTGEMDRACNFQMQKQMGNGVTYSGAIRISGFLSDSDSTFRNRFCTQLLPLLISTEANVKGDVRYRDNKSRYEVICKYQSERDYAYGQNNQATVSPISLSTSESENIDEVYVERHFEVQCQALAT